jgi:hypothetical protein
MRNPKARKSESMSDSSIALQYSNNNVVAIVSNCSLWTRKVTFGTFCSARSFYVLRQRIVLQLAVTRARVSALEFAVFYFRAALVVLFTEHNV